MGMVVLSWSFGILIQMSKLMLSKFKKSLGESSNIIFDSRLSNSIHRQLQVLEGFEKTPEEGRQIIDKSSLSNTYRNSHDNNKLIKKIPQLISENDQLKLKVQKLEDQLERILDPRRKNSTFSFKQEQHKFEEDFVKSSLVKRVSRIQNYSYPRTDKYSLDYRNRTDSRAHDRKHSKFYRQSNSHSQADFLHEKISELQQQISSLKRENHSLSQENRKLHAYKDRNSNEIDQIVAKFEQTLAQKEELSQAKMNIFEEKLGKLKKELDQCSKEKLSHIEENNKLREQIKKRIEMDESNRKVSEAQYYEHLSKVNLQAYRTNQAIDHLWQVKQVEYSNLVQVIHSLNHN